LFRDSGSRDRSAMPRATLHGRPTSSELPFWPPLIGLVGLELVDEFMWMLEILLEDDSMLHAYKHIETRRYLHLHEDGARAFVCLGPGRYREVDRRTALEAVIADWELSLVEDDDAGPIRAALATARARADDHAAANRDG